jgi:iron complex outermembrane recepter protein
VPAHKSDFNIYTKLQQQLNENWYVFADLQYRMVHYNIEGFEDNPSLMVKSDFNFVNPKAGVSYIKNYSNSLQSKAYGSFAVANKEPNRTDYEASPDQLPKAESLYDGEAGYQLNALNWGLGANFYYMQYKNQLILTGKINDVGAYTRQNVPNSFRRGIELTAHVKPVKWLLIQANATLSENKIKNFDEYIDDYDNGGQILNTYKETNITFSPSVIAGGTATFEPLKKQLKEQQFFIDLIGKYVGRQYLDNTTNRDRSLDPYGLCNVRLRYIAKVPIVKELGISLALNNVLNKKYEANGYTYSYQSDNVLTTENYYFPQAGINFLLGVSLRF